MLCAAGIRPTLTHMPHPPPPSPQVPVPPALQASSSSQKEYSFDYERRVLQEEGSKSVDTFLQKAEVCVGGWGGGCVWGGGVEGEGGG